MTELKATEMSEVLGGMNKTELVKAIAAFVPENEEQILPEGN